MAIAATSQAPNAYQGRAALTYSDVKLHSQTSADIVRRLKGEIVKALEPHLTSEPFALLDFPDHNNVGDSAIAIGEVDFFRGQGLAPAYVSSIRNHRDEKARGVRKIFLHGGGNFGDLWADYQAAREGILTRYHDIPIVQLPQSLHFQFGDALARTQRAIAGHKDFTLLVRDRKSLAFARQHFDCNSSLCPDMAFAMGTIQRPVNPQRKFLLLMRTDHEKNATNGTPQQLPAGTDVRDWVSEYPFTRTRTALTLVDKFFSPDFSLRYFERLGRQRLARGCHLLSSYGRVVSDRLHVHVLCTLMAIPHVVLDNSYGKIGGFIEAFETDWPGMARAETLSEAISVVQSLPEN